MGNDHKMYGGKTRTTVYSTYVFRHTAYSVRCTILITHLSSLMRLRLCNLRCHICNSSIPFLISERLLCYSSIIPTKFPLQNIYSYKYLLLQNIHSCECPLMQISTPAQCPLLQNIHSCKYPLLQISTPQISTHTNTQ